jgi:peptidoglycan/LPS O-acetylase OafA/YrhL
MNWKKEIKENKLGLFLLVFGVLWFAVIWAALFMMPRTHAGLGEIILGTYTPLLLVSFGLGIVLAFLAWRKKERKTYWIIGLALLAIILIINPINLG